MSCDVIAATSPHRPHNSASSDSTASDTLTAVSQTSQRGGGGRSEGGVCDSVMKTNVR